MSQKQCLSNELISSQYLGPSKYHCLESIQIHLSFEIRASNNKLHTHGKALIFSLRQKYLIYLVFIFVWFYYWWSGDKYGIQTSFNRSLYYRLLCIIILPEIYLLFPHFHFLIFFLCHFQEINCLFLLIILFC